MASELWICISKMARPLGILVEKLCQCVKDDFMLAVMICKVWRFKISTIDA